MRLPAQKLPTRNVIHTWHKWVRTLTTIWDLLIFLNSLKWCTISCHQMSPGAFIKLKWAPREDKNRLKSNKEDHSLDLKVLWSDSRAIAIIKVVTLYNKATTITGTRIWLASTSSHRASRFHRTCSLLWATMQTGPVAQKSITAPRSMTNLEWAQASKKAAAI